MFCFTVARRERALSRIALNSGAPPIRQALTPPMSQKSKKIRIQILNPVSGCGHTSLAHARRYVKRKEAIWDGPAIRFVPHTHVAASVKATHLTNGTGFATLKGVEGLPVAGPAIRLFTGKRPLTPPQENRVCHLTSKYLLVSAGELPPWPTPAPAPIFS